MTNFPVYNGTIPSVNREQMAEVDRLMIEKYGINLFQMMENAGRSLALVAKHVYLDKSQHMRACVLVGTGGNGGGGLVACRNLINWGYDVTILLSKEISDFRGVPRQQLETLLLMKANIFQFTEDHANKIDNCDLIIDAILGYNITGNPRRTPEKMIKWANYQKKAYNKAILSLDLPSGLAPDGDILHPVIRADATLTLALPKQVMFQDKAKEFIGDLFLADIGVPTRLYQSLLLSSEVSDLFFESNIIKIY